MSITEELRKWAEDNTLQDRILTTYPPQHIVHGTLETLLSIANRIDAEYQKAIRELNNLAEHSVFLPVDANGVPIRVGDWITGRWDAKAKVVAVTSDDVYWWEPDGCHWCHAFEVRHYHEPTVKDVLREMAIDWEYEENAEDREAVLEEYAAKLRLVKEDE